VVDGDVLIQALNQSEDLDPEVLAEIAELKKNK
jgi:hypothetical protein